MEGEHGTMIHPDVSVVVCTLNRADMLRPALGSLCALETGRNFTYEVLVVDNASTDHTSDVLRDAAAATDIVVRIVCEPRRGLPAVRNRGVREARGEWIAFFDDDQLADSRWLLELWRIAGDKRARCVGGAVRLQLPADWRWRLRPLCRVLLGETPAVDTPLRFTTRFTPGTGNLMVHRSVFDEIGMFDDAFQLRGEDTDLFLRIQKAGIEGWYSPAARIDHVIPEARLAPECMGRLIRLITRRIPQLDWEERGGAWVFPFLWGARWVRVSWLALRQLPAAWLRRDRAAALEARCQLGFAAGYSRDALDMIHDRCRARCRLAQGRSPAPSAPK